MSRKKRDFTRPILPDPKYGDHGVAKAINIMMISGKKGVAEKALYGALERVEQKLGEKALDCFYKALANVRPAVEVRSRRVGGATYQVPTEVRAQRSQALALRWITDAARSRGERTLADKLAAELMDAISNRGSAVKKREDTHRMAEANKAFAHFKW
ncbi:MAG: 30S ribosomal protein S7 [Oligoflexia bacterium]|nr:30S ribosomal protein S7 [Oligoflexia bacterium]